MFRKDHYNSMKIAALAALAMILIGAGTPIHADSVATSGTIHIDTTVSASFAPAASNAAQTVVSNTASVIVPQTAGVYLSPVLGSKRVTGAVRTLYPVTIYNTGNGTDIYTLSVARTLGWGVTLLNADGTTAPAQVTLTAGASQSFVLAVTPPRTTAPQGSGMAILKALSSVSRTVYGQAAAMTSYTVVR